MIPTILNHSNNSINFTSGINRKLSVKCLVFDVENYERILTNNGIDVSFQKDNSVAFCLSKVNDIFNKLKSKEFRFLFPQFRVFNQNQLINNIPNLAFCLPESQSVLKDESPFKTGSIFHKKVESIEELDSIIESDYKSGKRSSGHFLAEIIHEIMHGVFIDKIYKKYGYGGKCPFTKEKYPIKNLGKSGVAIMKELQVKSFSKEENNTIKEFLGEYSTHPINQYHEVFAEFFTKLICDTLSEKTALPVKNPKDEIKKYPKELLSIITKVLQV